MVQILLVLEVLLSQDSEAEDLFCGASSKLFEGNLMYKHDTLG